MLLYLAVGGFFIAYLVWATLKGASDKKAPRNETLRRALTWTTFAISALLASRGSILAAAPLLLGLALKLLSAKESDKIYESPFLRATLSPQGRLTSKITSGRFANRCVTTLTSHEIMDFLSVLIREDPEALPILAVYLDDRLPGWREHLHGRSNTGSFQETRPGAMTEEEAYRIFGLPVGADVSAIKRAYRELIQRVHPDTGGTDALAALLNEAKNTLLHNRHN